MPLQSAALDNTTREFFFNSCEWGVDNPWEWMYQYANSWRSGPDHHDNWDSTEHIIEHNVGLSKYAGKFFLRSKTMVLQHMVRQVQLRVGMILTS